MKSYEEFINHILETRGRFNCGDGYYEVHHVVPKCIGGTDEENNLIELFAKEHFIAHKLLAQENPENEKIVYAYTMMAFAKNENQERYELTPEEYEEAKITFSKIKSQSMKGENNPWYGKHLSEETKRKIRESKIGSKNPNYGKHLTEEQKTVLRKYNIGKKMSEEAKIKMRQSKIGLCHSAEARKKISENHADVSGKNNPKARKVDQYDKDGKNVFN
jgi:glutathione peroxidase-family protein